MWTIKANAPGLYLSSYSQNVVVITNKIEQSIPVPDLRRADILAKLLTALYPACEFSPTWRAAN